jgi:hypothetical protein
VIWLSLSWRTKTKKKEEGKKKKKEKERKKGGESKTNKPKITTEAR